MCASLVGIREMSRWHASVLPAENGCRVVVQSADVSWKAPLVRMTPPSDPSKIWVGLDGLTTIACWSGWIAFGATRHVEIPGSAHHVAGVFWAS